MWVFLVTIAIHSPGDDDGVGSRDHGPLVVTGYKLK
jgi:hypothetical protein